MSYFKRLLLTFTVCYSLSSYSAQTIRLTGSSTVAPVAKEMAEAFEREYPDIKVEVQTGGSSRGISDLRTGANDIGMISRSPNEKEKDLFAYELAKDGVSMILNSKNSVKSLTDDQIRAIYRGETTNWKQVGGVDKDIVVISKAAGRSTLELFLEHFKLKYSEIRAKQIVGDNEQAVRSVMAEPYSVGYVSVGTAEYYISQKAPIKALPLSGVEASIAKVKEGVFPLSRSLNFMTIKPATGNVKKFIDFALSEKNRKIIEDLYFVPVH